MEQCEYYCSIEINLTDNPKRRGPESETHVKPERAEKPLYIPGKLFASFWGYRRQALAAQALLDNGFLQVWTDTIRQLPNIITFDYGKPKEHSLACEKPEPCPARGMRLNYASLNAGISSSSFQ